MFIKLNLSTPSNQKVKLCTIGHRSADFKAIRGMTLLELMVAITVGSLILMVIATVFMTSARSMVSMGNYVNMNASSRSALDHMTLEIRQASGLTEFTSTRLKFSLPAQSNSVLVYDWNAATRQLTEWKTGSTKTNTLLTECDQLAFSLYNSSFLPTTNLSKSKGLSVNWKCSRTILGKKTTTEDMQQALIVIRNKS
jgi:prepilin-type N-terminal cleavage/methylation domain-containing protein